MVCVIILRPERLLTFRVIISPITAERGERQFIMTFSFIPLKFALNALSILEWILGNITKSKCGSGLLEKMDIIALGSTYY